MMTARRPQFFLPMLLLTACASNQPPPPAAAAPQAAPGVPALPPVVSAEASGEEAVAAAAQGPHRKAGHAARNRYRHPVETLTFFGLQRNMRVVELWPGGGWYTEVLGPVLAAQGKLVLANFDPETKGGRGARKLLSRMAAQPAVYGQPEPAILSMDAIDLGPAQSADMVLTFRSSHNWTSRGKLADVYAAAFHVLKSGGVFGVVQHRAPEGSNPVESAKKGYVPQAYVIATAEAAGFKLAESSEINANPRDTKDYEKGVWTLPPTLTMGEQDKARWLAIGESDRMTLRFVKP